MSDAKRFLNLPLSLVILGCSTMAVVGCGDDGSSDDPDEPAAGAGGSSGSSAGKGGGGSGNNGGSKASGGSSGSGGKNGGGAGKGGGGNPVVPTPGCEGDPEWTDVSSDQIAALGGPDTQSYPAGASGVLVNRLNGDVTIHIVGFGLWRSSDKGASWSRIDDEVIDANGGRTETGWGMQMDHDDPTRMATFTLDGTAGYTPDGGTWQQWADSGWGRNWDYGAIDWSAGNAQTIFGILHETTPRNLYLISTNGGTTWSAIDNNKVANMVGVVDSMTLIASRTTGIERSVDQGATWTSVSDITPLSHVAVKFQNKFYVTSADGIVVSADQGETWEVQGSSIAGTMMYQGPYFGADASTMVVGAQTTDNAFNGSSSIYKTTDGGVSWMKIADVPTPGNAFPITFAWFGSFAWDPASDSYYTTSMSNPVYRLDCTP